MGESRRVASAPQPPDGSWSAVTPDTALLIEQYYRHFNERHFVEASALFADDAVLEQLPLRAQERGGIGYLQFVSAWLRAFPDAVFEPRQISCADARGCEIHLTATGTHRGPLNLGGWTFRPTGTRVTFRFRELLQVQSGRITFSSLSFDLHEVVEKLTQPDVPLLLEHIQRLQQLAVELSATRDSTASRLVLRRIGEELDAARHVVRPYYRR